MQALALTAPRVEIIARPAPTFQDPYRWLEYFDPEAALQAVYNHIETLPGSRHERHTMRAYLGSLADYCAELGAEAEHVIGETYYFRFDQMRQPTKANTAEYIARCKRDGLSSNTITRYMAAVRHFLRALEEQAVIPRTGDDFVFINEAQRQFRLAAGVKNPAPDRTSNRPALEQFGTRLTLAQVNTLFASFDLETLDSRRDLALLYLGITSGLRAAELARLTLASITPGKDCFEVRVRGKRSNHDPVGIDADAYALILSFVDAFNHVLDDDDLRRITPDRPIFQPLLRGGSIPAEAGEGISSRAILQIVERRAAATLGIRLTAHDLRRSCAYLMRSNGFDWDKIRDQLRHRSIGTTEKYVGREQNLSAALLSKRVHFTLPSHNQAQGA